MSEEGLKLKKEKFDVGERGKMPEGLKIKKKRKRRQMARQIIMRMEKNGKKD